MLISPALACLIFAFTSAQAPPLQVTTEPRLAEIVGEAAWPATGFVYRFPEIPWPNWNSGHRGIDIEVEMESEVFAPASGQVTWVGEVGGDSGVSVLSAAGHRHTIMYTKAAVTEGQFVERGEIIGWHTSSDHCGFSNCIHWSVRAGDKYLDPRWLVREMIVLLP